jgi:hypothetical protein
MRPARHNEAIALREAIDGLMQSGPTAGRSSDRARDLHGVLTAFVEASSNNQSGASTMAQAQTTAQTTTTPGSSTNGNGKREVKPPTAIEAITKITKILDQLTPPDRKRVLAFVNESNVDNVDNAGNE